MVRSENGFSLLCLCALEEVYLLPHLESHFKLLENQRLIDSFNVLSINEAQALQMDYKYIRQEVDVLVLLLSTSFLATDFGQQHILSNLYKLHYGKTMLLLPILVHPCEVANTPLQRVAIFPSNHLPISSNQWDDVQQALYVAIFEIKPLVSDFKIKKEQLEAAWKEVEQSKSVSTIDNFLNLYPYSKYQNPAKKIRNQALEEQLWSKALLTPTLENLLEYLKSAPLQNHKEEAISKIIKLEEDETIAWQDTETNQAIAFFFDYKSRFPEGQHVGQAEKRLEELLAVPLDKYLDPEQMRHIGEEELAPQQYETQGYGLTYLAYQTLSPEEMLSYELISEYIERVNQKLSEARYKLSGWWNYLGALVVFMSLMIAAYLVLSFRNGIQDKTTSDLVLYMMLPFAIFLGVLYLLLNVKKQVGDDKDFCEKEQSLSEHNNIDLKIAFITHDKKNIRAALLRLWNNEKKADVLNEKRILDYLFKNVS